MRDTAKPKNRANTTNGSIALCAAAISALLGTMPLSQSAQPTCAAGGAFADTAPPSAAANDGWRVNRPYNIGAATAATVTPIVSSTTNTTSARRAVRPDAAASLAALTPTTTSANTSGTTVICRALSQRRPRGWIQSATFTATAES